ncbi:MAG: M48 family metalloprotease [Verrucomicrobia bacterium]|nr:M48 family metalloprotease [Verrucomicrobiota bacterium]
MTTCIDLFGQPLVQRLGWVLVHFVWQGTVVAAVWTILRSLLRSHDARTRYAVACLLLGLMAVSPLITFTLLESPAATSSAVAVDGMGRSGELIPATRLPSTGYQSMAIPAVTDQFAAALEGAIPWLVLVWCLGVGLLSLRLLQGYRSIRSVRSREVRPMEPAWNERLAELQRRLRMSRPVLLFESALIQVPVVIGWLRPMILVPASSLSGLTPQQLELILAHELAHIRRHDHWVNLLQVLIETLLFYHPAVWWISQDIRAERELCCDDLAVATCGNRLAYARALTTLEGLRQRSAAMALGAGGGSLMERIRHIVGLSASTVSGWRRPMGSALLGLGTLLFAAGVGCLALSPRQYVAVCRVAVEPDESVKVADFASGVSYPASPYDPYFITTEFEKLRSHPVLQRVAEELGLPMNPEEAYQQLRSRIDLRQVRNTSLIEIRVYSQARQRPAEEAAAIANKLAEVYAAHRAESMNVPKRRGIGLLNRELEGQDEAVQEAQARVDHYKLELQVSDLGAREVAVSAGFDGHSIRRLETERATLQANYEGRVQLLEQLKLMRAASEHDNDFRHAVLSALPEAVDVSRLLQELWLTEASLAKERISKGSEHPDHLGLVAMKAQLEKTLDERVQGILRGLELQVAAMKAQLDSLDRTMNEAKAREADLTARYAPYFQAKRDLENQQKIRDAILLRKLQETVDLQIPLAAAVEIVDPAQSSLRPVRARAGLGLGLCAAGLATGLCGLVVRGSARPPKL